MATNSKTTHVLVAAMPRFGHARPEITIALRLLTMHSNLRVTLLYPNVWVEPAGKIEKAFNLIADQRARLRTHPYAMDTAPEVKAHTGKEDDTVFIDHSVWMSELVEVALRQMVTGELKCENNEKPFPDFPEVALIDTLIYTGFYDREIDIWSHIGLQESQKPKIYIVIPLSFSFLAAYIGRKEAGMADIIDKYDQDRKRGITSQEAYQKHVVENQDRLVEKWGGGPMLPFEADPSEASPLRIHMKSWQILCEAHRLEPILVLWPSLSVFGSDHAQSSSGNMICIGPQQYPHQTGITMDAGNPVQEQSEDPTAQAMAWLDEAEREVGKQSVLYLCFGSEHWIPTAEQTDTLFDAIAASRLGSTNEPLRFLIVNPVFGERGAADELKKSVDRGLAKLGKHAKWLKWADQWQVLHHPAIGAFMSHGGSNSTQEAILTGVPLIYWPGAFDQPFIANQLSHLGCAYELVQSRTGHNIGRTTARGVKVVGTNEALAKELRDVLRDTFGEPGKKLRAEMAKLQVKVRKDMEEGESWKAMQSLGEVGRGKQLFWEQ